MKTGFRLIITCWFTLTGLAALAQDDAPTLTKAGIVLNNQKSYAAAIEKYKAALMADPDYAPANYQLAFTLNASGKGLDGIPYLQKVFQSSTASGNLKRGSYLLAGSIYDQNRQYAKAIAIYQEGINAMNSKTATPPTKLESQPMFYNLSLAYFHSKQYEKAERNIEIAVLLDPADATSQRIYALACFHQNKRAEALLGFCSFLMLEPNTARSAEAYGNIQHILQGGVLKPEPGQTPFSTMAETIKLNQAVTASVKGFATRRYASAGDLLAAQLKAVFTAVNSTITYTEWNSFFRERYADYFYKLSQTANMPAFARLISLSTPESHKMH
jgi:tetratricopeptide (TPR) repeat protein